MTTPSSTSPTPPPPRLFGITATAAPIVAVLRRGPSEWFHLGRWDIERASFESGAWLHATLYPQRCDVSPDGRYLCYMALDPGSTWSVGETYIAISKLPSASALAAWSTMGTWSRGAHFVDANDLNELGAPEVGDIGPLLARYGLALNRPESFCVERRRGWRETPDTPPRADHDTWDERRGDAIVVSRARPGDAACELFVHGHYAAFRGGPYGDQRERSIHYELRYDSEVAPLADVQWADWSPSGALLVATLDGRLQCRTGDAFEVASEIDLAAMQPEPRPAPADARRW